eukprot:Sdes_comp15789_c0_seq1m4858
MENINAPKCVPPGEGDKAQNHDETSLLGGKSSKTEEPPSNDNNNQSEFECNICLDTPTDAVISLCGHLYCWPCLHQWLELHGDAAVCPVCKAGIGKDQVIPLYGRGNKSKVDPREKPPPPRPAGQRPEPSSSRNSARNPNFFDWNQAYSPFGSSHFQAGGTQISFVAGLGPFGILPSLFQLFFSTFPNQSQSMPAHTFPTSASSSTFSPTNPPTN